MLSFYTLVGSSVILYIFYFSGFKVTQLQATDPEGDPLTYGIIGEEAMKFFNVSRDGVVSLKRPLDREVRRLSGPHS